MAYQEHTIGPRSWPLTPGNLPRVNIDAAGLVALADLTTIATRTCLTGTSCLLDAFVLCPGIHRQAMAPELNGGEYPACGAMTSGYVFRVENPATVVYLQKVGRTGKLTNLVVEEIKHRSGAIGVLLDVFAAFHNSTLFTATAYLGAVAMTVTALTLLAMSSNKWGLAVFLILMFARLCNVIVTRRRCVPGWTGAKEPGVKGDLIVLLSQDRWIRIRGMVDHLKAVTSGQWLREMTFIEGSFTALATVLIYLDAALASNVDQSGKIVLLVVLICSVGSLAIANQSTHELQMKGFIVRKDGPRRSYGRRRDMAEELIKESGRKDWAMRLGMIVPASEASEMGPAIM